MKTFFSKMLFCTSNFVLKITNTYKKMSLKNVNELMKRDEELYHHVYR